MQIRTPTELGGVRDGGPVHCGDAVIYATTGGRCTRSLIEIFYLFWPGQRWMVEIESKRRFLFDV